jgi:2-methylisocitrate lyase-like PEP mutase family enzyme
MIVSPTPPNMLQFIEAVQAKTAEVTLAYTQHGRDLMSLASPAIRDAVSAIAEMQKRHARGDYVHTEKELQALKDYSKWLVEAWHRLRGTETPATTWINEL